MTLFNSIALTIAALVVVFYVIHRKPTVQVCQTAVRKVMPITRKVTPITDAQRQRLTLLAHYAAVSVAHAK